MYICILKICKHNNIDFMNIKAHIHHLRMAFIYIVESKMMGKIKAVMNHVINSDVNHYKYNFNHINNWIIYSLCRIFFLKILGPNVTSYLFIDNLLQRKNLKFVSFIHYINIIKILGFDINAFMKCECVLPFEILIHELLCIVLRPT